MLFIRHVRMLRALFGLDIRGIEWIFTCLANIRDWVPGRVVLCKRLRENGKLLEFCGSSNRAGLFVVKGLGEAVLWYQQALIVQVGLCFRES